MICITHLKFRRAMQRAGKVTAFQSFAYPLTNWLCLLFLAAILGVMYLTPDIRISVCLIPVWLLILAAGYLLRRKSARRRRWRRLRSVNLRRPASAAGRY